MENNKVLKELLTDMRCQVEYTHVATMPIPLYERIKQALSNTGINEKEANQ